MKLKFYLRGLRPTFACILFPLTIFGQINITFPSSRIVFQRDNFGNGTIRVTGQYSKSVDRVEARVIPMSPGQGEQTDWRTIQDNPQGGFYSGSITVRGGWYELQIRGIVNGNTVSTSELQRVGVGEVFLVAGQSNAQGFFNYGAPGPGDDRVNCVNYRNNENQNNSFPKPDFVRMSDNGNVGPRGLSSWCWGRLGDMITSRFNVPVLFYNAAWEGTASKNWSETVDGGTTNSIYINDTYPQGQPYGNLRLALNYYASLTGVRAVLWHQGEADNILNTSAVSYQSNLRTIIEKSRQHFGKNVGWVIARTSYYNTKGNNPEIINGQNQTVLNNNSVFFGPNTDGIQTPRPDGAHFQNGGLSDAANAWNSALDDNFFNSCFPQTGSFPNFSVSCAGGNQLSISVQGPYTSVQWSNGASGPSINVGPGNYSATVRDFVGNVYFTPTINVPNDLQSAPVNISVDGKLPLCQGSTIGLISSGATGNQWNTGSTSQRIEVSAGGTYSVSTENIYGCKGSASINVTTISSPPPARPTIAASGPLTFCQGGSVNLTSTSGAEYRWSTGDRGQVVTARNSGTYEVRVLDDKGCTSEPANVTIQVNTPPAAPTINASGNTSFCQGGRVRLASNYTDGNIWSSGQQTKEIEVTASGNYNVRFRDSNGCDAISNNITVTVNPLPSAPIITPERPIVFCDGDSTILTSSNSAQYTWNNGARSRRITILKPGSFSLTVTDANGCTSPGSEVVNVRVNSLPAAPTITTDRPTVICENEVVTLTSSTQSGYIWSNGQNTQSVTVNLPGRYSARTVDANQCQSPSSNIISVTVNALPPKPVITALGPTTFCQGGRVSLTTNYSTGIAWSNFQNTQTITATTDGNYNVSYVDNNGCRSVSDAFPVKVNPLPAAPTIVNERPTTFCEFDNTILTITSGGNIFEWSNGERGRSIKVYSAGEISATIFEPSTGCTSPSSPPIRIVVNPNPSRPTISVGGATTICADQSVTLTAPDASAYQWSNNANTKSIAANFAGNYTLVVRNQFGCPSPVSEAITINVNPLPPVPSIISEGRLTFCDGDQVGLRVETNYAVVWNTGESTKRIIATKSGNYAARVRDQIGCLSPFTGPTRVDVKALPSTPVIEKIGVYTLQINNPTPSAVYSWKSGSQSLNETTPVIRVNQSGSFTATASVQYSPTLTCVSKTSAVFEYILEVTNNGLAVYPNPSSDGKVVVETLEILTNATLIVYDLTGKPVQIIQVPSFNEQKLFDFTKLPVGVYTLQVQAQDFNKSKKLIIAQ